MQNVGKCRKNRWKFTKPVLIKRKQTCLALIANSVNDTFYFAAKSVLIWIAPHVWAFFLLFRVHKEEPYVEFYRLLNLSCKKLIDLIIHTAPWKSYTHSFQSFKLIFRSVYFNYMNSVWIKWSQKEKINEHKGYNLKKNLASVSQLCMYY